MVIYVRMESGKDIALNVTKKKQKQDKVMAHIYGLIGKCGKKLTV